MRLSNPSIRLIAAVIALLWGAASAWPQAKPPTPAKQPEKSAPASKTAAPQATAPAKTPAPSKSATAPAQKAPAPKAAVPAPKSSTAAPKVKPQAAAPKAAPKAKGTGEKPAAAAEESVSMRQGTRRDPFEYLVGKKDKGGPLLNLPAGKAGLVIATMRLDGVVRHQAGMIAVVSNPQQRVYFIREGDRLYDGRVEKISMDGIVMRELSKDAFGKPLERVVTKRIYPSAGEQQ